MKKTGDRDSYILAIQEFQNFISHNGLLDAGYKGPKFIWCNNLRGRERIWERLDIVLYRNNLPTCSITDLPRVCSDHTPLGIKLQDTIHSKSRGFLFQRMWVDHPSFLQIVATDWENQISGTPESIVYKKLGRLRRTLQDWNWNSFGNILQVEGGTTECSEFGTTTTNGVE